MSILIFLLLFCFTKGEYIDAEDNNYQVPDMDGRIIGGVVADQRDYPYLVSVRRNNGHTCGGAILSQTIIITAAHCVANKTGVFSVNADSADRKVIGTSHMVITKHIHKQFNPKSYDYDVAILKLWTKISFGPTAAAITLPKPNYQLRAGAKAVCAGWGRTEEKGKGSPVMRMVRIQIFDRDSCVKNYKNYLISQRMICAGVPGGGKDACYGDSGGPLVVDGKLVGIVSWGVGCARPKYPGVYANVLNLLSFIEGFL